MFSKCWYLSFCSWKQIRRSKNSRIWSWTIFAAKVPNKTITTIKTSTNRYCNILLISHYEFWKHFFEFWKHFFELRVNRAHVRHMYVDTHAHCFHFHFFFVVFFSFVFLFLLKNFISLFNIFNFVFRFDHMAGCRTFLVQFYTKCIQKMQREQKCKLFYLKIVWDCWNDFSDWNLNQIVIGIEIAGPRALTNFSTRTKSWIYIATSYKHLRHIRQTKHKQTRTKIETNDWKTKTDLRLLALVWSSNANLISRLLRNNYNVILILIRYLEFQAVFVLKS